MLEYSKCTTIEEYREIVKELFLLLISELRKADKELLKIKYDRKLEDQGRQLEELINDTKGR